MPEPFTIANAVVQPGEARRLEIHVARLVTQTPLALPVVVVHGTRPGHRLWLSAAIHGDELNGTEIIRRVLLRVNPERLHGTLIAVPVVNVWGFLGQSRYLPDRRDLNRTFPGSAKGSLAARLAHLFLTEIVGHCTHGIDLHTGSNNRINLPQVRGDLDIPEVRELAEGFGAPLMIHGGAPRGSLREAAGRRGIPILVYEAGEPQRFNRRSIAVGTRGVLRTMQHLGMLKAPRHTRLGLSLEIRKTTWVRANRSGIAHLEVALRDQVEKGQVLGVMRDTLGDQVSRLRAPTDGIVIGHSTNPLVNRGEAVVHLAELGSTRAAMEGDEPPRPKRKKR